MGVWVLVVQGGVGQGSVVAVVVGRGVVAPRPVQQRQAVGHLVVEVWAAGGRHGSPVPVPAVDAAVDPAGARQGGVLQNVPVHLGRLVQVPGGVVLWGRRGGNRGNSQIGGWRQHH